MKLERFKEKDKKKIGIIIFTISCLLLVAGVYFYTSFALFEQNQNFNVINGSVQDPGDIYFTFYKDNVITKSMPTKEEGYILDATKSSCTKGATPELDTETWNIKVLNMTESRTKCTLYFEKTAVKTIVELAEKDQTNLAYDETNDNNLRYVGANPMENYGESSVL